jgi:hypothetical protein
VLGLQACTTTPGTPSFFLVIRNMFIDVDKGFHKMPQELWQPSVSHLFHNSHVSCLPEQGVCWQTWSTGDSGPGPQPPYLEHSPSLSTQFFPWGKLHRTQIHHCTHFRCPVQWLSVYCGWSAATSSIHMTISEPQNRQAATSSPPPGCLYSQRSTFCRQVRCFLGMYVWSFT